MAFALTKYFFPLKEDIVLSDHLNYALTNPSDDEVQALMPKISEAIENYDRQRLEGNLSLKEKLVLGIRLLVEKLQDAGTYQYELDFLSSITEHTLICSLTKMWIIVRFEEDEGFDVVLDNHDLLFSIAILNPSKNKNLSHLPAYKPALTFKGYEDNFEMVSSYCHVLSLVSHNESYQLGSDESYYYGDTFLIHSHPFDIFESDYEDKIFKTLIDLSKCYHDSLTSPATDSWLNWIHGKDAISSKSNALDILIEQGKKAQEKKNGQLVAVRKSQKQSPLEKFLHVGSLLRVSSEQYRNPRIQVLLLASIIEYLLTTDQESISKQFKFKTSEIIQSVEPEIDDKQIQKLLSEAYELRSMIAHGNYSEKLDIRYLINNVYFLFFANRCIIQSYINDREVVEQLKDS